MLAGWRQRASEALARQDDANLSVLLGLRDGHATTIFSNAVDSEIQQIPEGPLRSHAEAATAWYRDGNAEAAFSAQKSLVQSLKGTAWAVHSYINAAKEWKSLYGKAKLQLLRNGKDATSLNSSFVHTLKTSILDLIRSDKHHNILPVCNILFQFLYEGDNISLMKSMFTQVKDVVPKAHKSDLVRYYFNRGRFHLQLTEFDMALRYLTEAFRICQASAVGPRSVLLEYLIPLRLRTGSLPSERLLTQYGLIGDFGDLVTAIRRGDVARFDAAFARSEERFIQRGTWFLYLQDALFVLFVNLFKRVHRLRGGQSYLLLSDLTTATRVGRPAITEEEVECIVANLIEMKRIRGRINLATRRVVALEGGSLFSR